MIQVVRHGNYIRNVTCDVCHCVLTYNISEDIRIKENGKERYGYVLCPECKNKIKI